ncbi:MAG TPA: MFS transporter [Pseudonocardiaceae bacterium]|nr:MFS transporter [Pseudonocardiaceae bacterium]
MTSSAGAPSPRAGRREWIGLGVLALPTILSAMDFGVLYLALPHLGSALHASSTQLLWIQDVYGFLIAGFLVTMGNLGDRVGRRRLLMIGAAAFGVLSVISAYSNSAALLIGARALLGIAGATLQPSILALISNMFRNDRQRSIAISLWATSLLVGVALGPLVGGALLQKFWWGSVFLIGVPVMVLLLVTAPFLVPEYRDRGAGRIDLLSVLLSLAAVIPIVYAIKEIARSGLQTGNVIALVIGLVAGIVFVLRQRGLAEPLLDLRLFGNREFSSALGILLFGSIAIGGLGLLFSQYLQLVHTLSPLRAGLLMLPDTAGLIGGSLLTPVVARRLRPAYVIGIGLVISAAGFVVLTQVSPDSSLVVTVLGVVVATVGIAPTWVLGTDLIVGSVPPEKAGSAAAISETSSELGVALGVALLGAIGVAVYRGDIGGHIPAGLSADAAQASGDTLVGAVSAVAQLPARLATPLIDAARSAFTNGFAVAAIASVPVLIVLAALSVVLLRNLNPADDSEAPSD